MEPEDQNRPLKVDLQNANDLENKHVSNIVQVLWYGIEGYAGLEEKKRRGFGEIFCSKSPKLSRGSLELERATNMVLAFAEVAVNDDNENIWSTLTKEQQTNYKERVTKLIQRVSWPTNDDYKHHKFEVKDREALQGQTHGRPKTLADKMNYMVEIVYGEMVKMAQHVDVSWLAKGNQQNKAYLDLHEANQKPSNEKPEEGHAKWTKRGDDPHQR